VHGRYDILWFTGDGFPQDAGGVGHLESAVGMGRARQEGALALQNQAKPVKQLDEAEVDRGSSHAIQFLKKK